MSVHATVSRATRVAIWIAAMVAAPAFVVAQSPNRGRDTAGGSERPGLLRAGGFYFTPYLHVGTVGVDTNVFYTATERQTDFTASGGPGLEVVRPLGMASRIRLDGGLDYLYFARTGGQRRLNGYGSGLIDVTGLKTELTLEGRWARTYSRPNIEVNERVQQETSSVRLFARRVLTERVALTLSSSARRTDTEDVEYLGAPLGSTLTGNDLRVGGELRRALTVKTHLVAGGETAWYRFSRAAARDGRSMLAYGGLRTDATALIGGQALAGMRWFELDAGGRRQGVYASVDGIWNISPKTKIGGGCTRDIDYSTFDTSGTTPTNRVETAGVFLDKLLVRGLYLRVFGQLRRLGSDGAVTLTENGATASAVRDDEAREVGGELGWQFRARWRVGARAAYGERTSPFATFGVHGLLAGLTVQYNPPQPSFR